MQHAEKAVPVSTWRVVAEMLMLAANAVLAGVAVSVTTILFVVWLANVAP